MSSSAKRRVSVTIDAALVDAIDRFSDNRSAVIEDALRLWQAHGTRFCRDERVSTESLQSIQQGIQIAIGLYAV